MTETKGNDKDKDARLEQLEADVMAIASRLGLIRVFGDLVHKDDPATKADADKLIEEVKKMSR